MMDNIIRVNDEIIWEDGSHRLVISIKTFSNTTGFYTLRSVDTNSKHQYVDLINNKQKFKNVTLEQEKRVKRNLEQW